MKVYFIKGKYLLLYLSIFLLVILSVVIAVGFKNDEVKIANAKEEKMLPIYSVENDDEKIALTFDCAWGISDVDSLLTLLKESKVKATFFVTGKWCDEFPDVIKQIHSNGHSVQNHSNSHPHVSEIEKIKLIDDTNECDNKIKALTGAKPTFYRAPYGEYDVELLTTFKETLGHQVVQWNVDSRDWQKKTAKEMVKNVLKSTTTGSIILFHTDISASVVALKEIIPKLKEKKFNFVTINELVYNDNYLIDNNGTMKKIKT